MIETVDTTMGQAGAKRGAAIALAVVGLVMAVAGALGLVGLAVANHDSSTRTFSGVRVLEIEGGAADVKVEATGDEVGGQVSVEIRRRWSWRKPAVDGRMEGGRLRLGSGCRGAVLGVCEVSFLVRAPATVPLTVRTGSGDVGADGMRAGVDLRTGSGDVAATAVSGAHLRVHTRSGNVRVEVDGQPPDEVVAETGSGDVVLTLPDAAYRIQTRTGSGDVDTSAITQDPASTHHVSATTGSGDVDIRRG